MKNVEFSPLPEEFATRGAEFSPIAPEYEAEIRTSRKSVRKKKKIFSAAVVLLIVLFFLEPIIQQPLPAEEPVAAEPSSLSDTSAPDVTAAPGISVSDNIPDEPVMPPSCEPVFICFSDELAAKLKFSNPEAIISVHAELWDSIGDTLEQTWDVPQESILSGEYELPDMPGLYSIYMNHHNTYDPNDPFPVPELKVSMVCLDEDREETVDITQPYAEELGWSVRDKGEQIVFRTYESRKTVVLHVADSDTEEAVRSLADGDFLIVIMMNGTYISEADCQIEQETQVWTNSENEDVEYFYASLSIPKNSGNGKAVITVYQKLEGYDTVWSRTIELEY